MKRSIRTTLAAVILINLLISFQGLTYYIGDISTVTPISAGVTHTHIRQLDSAGWNNINIIRVDLNEPTVSLKTLFSGDGISKLSPVLTMAQSNPNVVAAVNSDFFSWYSQGGSSEGLTVVDNRLITSPSNDPIYSTIALTLDKTVIMDYFTFDIMVTSKRTGGTVGSLFYNKYAHETYMKIYDRSFGAKSPGSHEDGYEVVVDNGVVVDVLSNQDGVDIPQNGYVLHNSLRYSLALMENFEIGDEVELSISISPNIDNIDHATGGGTLLLKNGEKARFTLPNTTNPSTACGVDITGKILYMVTVDGRQGSSRGMNFDAMSDFLRELGCYNAISFDGGGSTTMVGKFPREALKVLNTPTSIRSVSTALAVAVDRTQPSLGFIKVTPSVKNLFLGCNVDIWAEPLDKYLEPFELGESVVYSADKAGYFDGNRFYPEEAGIVTITASSGNISGSAVVEVFEAPACLNVSTDRFTATTNPQSFSVSGKDKYGNTAYIPSELLNVNFTNASGAADSDRLILTEARDGAVTFSYKEAVVTLPIGNYHVESRGSSDPVLKAPKNGGYTLGVFGNNGNPRTLFNSLLVSKRNYAANQMDLSIFRAVPEQVSSYARALSGYGKDSNKDSVFLLLDNRESGLNSNNQEQWRWFLNTTANGAISQKNVFILLPRPLSSFADDGELAIFKKRIKENLAGKNVFIITYDKENTYHSEGGIHYVTVCDLPPLDTNNMGQVLDRSKYARFTVNGEDVSLEFVSYLD